MIITYVIRAPGGGDMSGDVFWLNVYGMQKTQWLGRRYWTRSAAMAYGGYYALYRLKVTLK